MEKPGISRIGIIVLLILVVCASGCTETGSGNVVKESRTVSNFKYITLNGDINLIITQGSTETLTIEADDSVIQNVKTEVKNNRLTISYVPPSAQVTKEVNVYLTVKDLNSIDIYGSGTVKAANIETNKLNVYISGSGNAYINNLSADQLTANISGSGSIEVSGKVQSQNIKIDGSGEYLAKTLESTDAVIVITGSGDATLNSTEKLNITIEGSGKVSYTGDPQVKQNISGSGTVNKL